MDYNFINQNTSSLSTNVIDYSQVQGTFPVTYNNSSSYNPYPSTSYNNDSSSIESYQNDYLAQTYSLLWLEYMMKILQIQRHIKMK